MSVRGFVSESFRADFAQLEGAEEATLPRIAEAGDAVKRREQLQRIHFELTEAFNRLNTTFYTVGAMASQPMSADMHNQLFDLGGKLAAALANTRAVLETMDHIMRKEIGHG